LSLLRLTIVDLLDRFRRRAASPVDLADAVLGQLERVEPRLNAFVVREAPEEVRRAAEASAARWTRGEPIGPLDGIPITIKDAILARPWPMRAGSKTTAATPGDVDAPAVARAREAGAIILGKTTTPEFGWKAVTDSPLTGISRNPWDERMTPGGSSGGAAAAVAAGAAVASIGTDAGGSVRIPASFCGLAALKATRGRIPAFPASAVWTAGHIGPIARSVQDIALMLGVMAQPDARDWNALPPPFRDYLADLQNAPNIRGLRIAYSPTLGHAKVDPEVAALVAAAAARFAELGANVEQVDAPLPDARQAFLIYFQTGISHALRHLTPAQTATLDPSLAQTLEAGKRIPREQFLEAYEFQIRISREARLLHERFDLLITPTVAVPAFTAGRNCPEGYGDNWLDWSPFTYPFNLSGQPAATVNCGFTRQRLPVGVQIVGPMHDEAIVLRAARAYEASTNSEVSLPDCVPHA
jgi:aspartyl-tRNA(Asn)/glutamyl-tRNA(Gln) amidotransferase subunit A